MTRHRPLGVCHIAAEVPVAVIDIDVAGELRVLGADARRPRRKTYLRHLSQRHCAAAVQGDENLGCDRLRIAAIVARVADAHGVALATLDRRRHRLGAKRHGDQILQVGDHEAVARELRAIGIDVEVVAADHALGVALDVPGTVLRTCSI